METKKVTLLFPGQGSQYVGMGKRLQDCPEAWSYFRKADEVLNYSISKLCLEGPEDKLKLTENTQPAILTYSLALLNWAEKKLEKKLNIQRVLGHSVGEYPALVCAGALSFEDAVVAVHNRGKYMQEAVPVGVGKMIAVLMVPEEVVRQACEKSSSDTEKVAPANYNDPSQIVISGHALACDKAIEWIKNNYPNRFRSIELPVSAPFHCQLMETAATKLAHTFKEKIKFQSTKIPYIANINATEYGIGTNGETVQKNLIDQVVGSVMWTQSIQKLPSDTICIEMGPGKVLTGLVRKINPEIKVIPIDTDTSIEEIRNIL